MRQVKPSLLGIALGALLLNTGCDRADPAAEATAAPLTPIKTQTLDYEIQEESSEFVGRLEAADKVEVKPESQGRIQAILVESGQAVAKGEVLMTIEPDRSQPQLESARAALVAARADRDRAQDNLQTAQSERDTARSELELARVNFQRANFLIEQGAIGQLQFDQAKQQYEAKQNSLQVAEDRIRSARSAIAQAEAAIEQARANVEASQIDLEFKRVSAPISGILDDIPVKVGDFVTAGQEGVALIARNDLLDLKISVPASRRQELERGLPVVLIDPVAGEPLATGEINFISPRVNSEAQAIMTKARFANVDGTLRDGQNVEARIIWNTQPGLLVPVTAVTRTGGQNFVYLVDEVTTDGGETQTVVRLQSVELGDVQRQDYQVIEGLEPGSRIAVSNLLKLKDGVPVQPES